MNLETPHGALSVALRLDENGPEVALEGVTEADLAEAVTEAWLQCCLRKGHPDVAIDDFHPRLLPLVRKDGPRCSGFALEIDTPSGETARCEFTARSVASAATRAAQRLLNAGGRKADETYYYELLASRRPMLPVPPHDGAEKIGTFTVTAKHPPLTYLRVPLPPLLRRARTVGQVDQRDMHVFYTEEALARTERFARKGAAQEPPIETGAVQIGPLCSCQETGEFFVVVCEALEVLDAEGTEFSLTYSGKSWARIQTVMKVRQSQAATRAHRIVGQGHGHNFMPANGAPPCEHCHKVKECTRTSVFVSLDDRTWSRAVFSRQPWQLCHIFGLNARSEQVQRLFGLCDGRLLERGFHVIPEFDATTV
jgi:hypothetical protein